MRRLRGPGANQVRDIDRELLIRRAAADIVLGDPEVSRRHALSRPVPAGDLRVRPVDVQRTIVFADVPKAGQLSSFTFNQKLFDPSRVDITMKLGSVEEWTLENPSTGPQYEWHTFHVHQNPFQVISVNGEPAELHRLGGQRRPGAGGQGGDPSQSDRLHRQVVFHCRVVFHEDRGMMVVAQVLANPTPSQVNANRVVYLSPHAGHTLYAGLDLTGSALRGFLYYCRHLGRAWSAT